MRSTASHGGTQYTARSLPCMHGEGNPRTGTIEARLRRAERGGLGGVRAARNPRRELTRHDAEATIDIEHLAGDAAAHVAEQEHARIAHFQLVGVLLQWGV